MSIMLDNKEITVTGKLIKIARVKDEWYEEVKDFNTLIKALDNTNIKADLFTFWQSLPEIGPKYNYHMEFENVAAINIISFEHWWAEQINNNTRNAIRRALREGLSTKVINFDDKFVRGVTEIYNESPVRLGRLYPHYGDDFDTIKKKIATFLDRSDFIGAYYNGELIGYIKQTYVGNCAFIMNIISKVKHFDKSPTNALLAKAVEVCAEKKVPYLIYGQYVYGKKGEDSLTEFKRHNGFEKINIPRYYIPLTAKGKIALKLGIHNSIVEMLPGRLIKLLIKLRAKWYSIRYK